MEWTKIDSMKYGKIVFHSMPCQQHKSNKIAYKLNLPAFFKLNIISCFILSRDVEAEAITFCESESTLMKKTESGSELGSD